MSALEFDLKVKLVNQDTVHLVTNGRLVQNVSHILAERSEAATLEVEATRIGSLRIWRRRWRRHRSKMKSTIQCSQMVQMWRCSFAGASCVMHGHVEQNVETYGSGHGSLGSSRDRQFVFDANAQPL